MRAALSVGLAVRLMAFRAHWRGEPPKAGEYIVSAVVRGRAAYRIVSVRPTRSLRYPLHLRCQRVARIEIPADARVHQWVSDRSARRSPLRSPLL